VTTRDVGDRINVQYLAYNAAGVLTAATVVLTVTDPRGAATTPTVTATSTGVYDASFTLASAGLWSWVWTVSGTIIDVASDSVLAASPPPPTYASMSDLKSYVGNLPNNDVIDDAELQDALVSASRGIDHMCGRSFWPSLTATARTFQPRDPCVAIVDDFWTSTGLTVKTDSGDDGVFETTLTTASYSLEPLNGVVSGEPGWPFYRIVAVNTWFPIGARPSLEVTAKWGWSQTPGPIRQACLQLASETFKLKGAPFGVAGFGEFGPIRVRDNPRVMAMIEPYRRYAILMA
jgi:hypothetical protein